MGGRATLAKDVQKIRERLVNNSKAFQIEAKVHGGQTQIIQTQNRIGRKSLVQQVTTEEPA